MHPSVPPDTIGRLYHPLPAAYEPGAGPAKKGDRCREKTPCHGGKTHVVSAVPVRADQLVTPVNFFHPAHAALGRGPGSAQGKNGSREKERIATQRSPAEGALGSPDIFQRLVTGEGPLNDPPDAKARALGTSSYKIAGIGRDSLPVTPGLLWRHEGQNGLLEHRRSQAPSARL